MVTPTNGTVRFRGLKTGGIHSVNIYIADAVGTRVKFSTRAKAAATDPDYIQFTEPVELVDMSILTGPTVIFALVPTSAATEIQNKSLAIADCLNTLQTRAVPSVKWNAGSNIGFKEA